MALAGEVVVGGQVKDGGGAALGAQSREQAVDRHGVGDVDRVPGDIRPVCQRSRDWRIAIDRLDPPLAGETFDDPSADESGGSGEHQPRR
jgi:hypothetical protein